MYNALDEMTGVELYGEKGLFRRERCCGKTEKLYRERSFGC